ncbi:MULTISPECIES: GGDEF domain-containing protein [unclassified Vibrio]|uniref:GGDEF domain-containing protein n=1 Tax=unclassified Vibrio TaxID=2614977 RepID=UPI00159E29CD|nr:MULTISPECIES: diguanylate cyclase [unclassified Vibrio]NVN83681.1 diguanylate cyclase [Vibrio sp. Scap16]QLE94485.1 diguanylate cyclase [Vibrio sp. Scap24]
MGLVLLACSLFPVYLAGQLILNKQNESSLEQKEIKLANSTAGIQQTVQEQINLTASLTQWYSQDRSLIKAGGNIFFSSVVWDKMDSFNALADSVSATYILDSHWKPIYDSKGSLYHFEQSQLLEDLKRPQAAYKQGKLVHTEFTEPEIADNADSGLVFVAPILPYRLIEGSSYTPQGYLVVLMGYDRLESKVAPFLYDKEFVEFDYLAAASEQHAETDAKLITNDNKLFSEALTLTLKHHVSDSARLQEMQQSQVVFVRILFVTLAVAIVFALLLNRAFSRQLNLLTGSVESYSNNQPPTHNADEHRFTEFTTFSRLLEKMWSRIQRQLSELTVRNDQLRSAYQQIKENNLKLESFNTQLEQTVEEKTSRLTHSLAREEAQKNRILKIVKFASMRQSVEYRLIPEHVNRQLKSLLPDCLIEFSFNSVSCREVADGGNADSDIAVSDMTNSCRVLKDSKETTIGYFYSQNFTLLSEEDLLIFDLYQKQLAGWIELENMNRINMSTGCYNRKAFDEDLNFSKQRATENKDNLSLLIIDINGLKAANDQYGHAVGDELIKGCTDVIRNRLCGASNLYRLGGDEFAILTLMPAEQPMQEPQKLAERLYADQIDQTVETQVGVSIPVRFSIGVASTESTDIDELFSQADEDMYRQKRRYYQDLTAVGK